MLYKIMTVTAVSETNMLQNVSLAKVDTYLNRVDGLKLTNRLSKLGPPPPDKNGKI